MYRQHTHCRACGYAKPNGPEGIKSVPSNEALVPVFNLGVQPLANDFKRPDEELSGWAPLKVMFCPRCTLAQLSVVVSPGVLYSKYPYVTSPSETMKQHFKAFGEDIMCIATNPIQSVLEIGSNDGRFLEHMRSLGIGTLVGIDPAENLAKIAEEKDIPTINAPFNAFTAADLNRFDLVVARHVFCHVNDWRDFMAALYRVTHKDSLVAIETPYCADLLRNHEFDTIYHEHLSYLTLRSMAALVEHTQFQIDRFTKYQIHGGALVIVLSRKDSGRTPHPSVLPEIEAEKIGPADWKMFAAKASEAIGTLTSYVYKLRQEGKTVAALGASAKSTVWINACGFTRKEISFIADTTVQKWQTLSPGAGIPILDEGAILRELPDYLILFAWNYAGECIEKNRLYLEKGGKIIVPIPRFSVIGADSVTKEE